MSLRRYVRSPEVSARLTYFQLDLPSVIDAPLRIEPRTPHYMLVGTAFDYLLRFELQRRSPMVVCREWVAEDACRRLEGEESNGATVCVVVLADEQEQARAARRARAIVASAKADLASHCRSRAPSRNALAGLARHTIRLAKLEPFARGGGFDPTFEEVDEADVEDLLALLEIVPYPSLVTPAPLLLNPAFGDSGSKVGGADADLVVGDLLVDVKVTKSSEIKRDFLNQLLGYFLLARREGNLGVASPPVNRAGLYFCRHGHLWQIDVRQWTDKRGFADLEEWFFAPPSLGVAGGMTQPSRKAGHLGRPSASPRARRRVASARGPQPGKGRTRTHRARRLRGP